MVVIYLRVFLKLITFITLIAGYLLTTSLNSLLLRDAELKMVVASKITSFCAKVALFILGVDIKVHFTNKADIKNGNFFIVSNHSSYIDELIICSVLNCVFIVPTDGVQQQFPLGLITRNSGAILIDRKVGKKIKEDIEKIVSALRCGFNVVLFPEGTTSEGNLLPFKTPFFSAPIVSGVETLPVVIKYLAIDGESVTDKNKRVVLFYEKIGFFNHFVRLLKTGKIELSITFMDAINSDKVNSRKELSNIVFKNIEQFYTNKL